MTNFIAITGTDSAIINGLPYLHLVTIVVAIAVALRARQERPEIYANMGRTLVD